MSNKLTESAIEDFAIKRFGRLGYAYSLSTGYFGIEVRNALLMAASVKLCTRKFWDTKALSRRSPEYLNRRNEQIAFARYLEQSQNI